MRGALAARSFLWVLLKVSLLLHLLHLRCIWSTFHEKNSVAHVWPFLAKNFRFHPQWILRSRKSARARELSRKREQLGLARRERDGGVAVMKYLGFARRSHPTDRDATTQSGHGRPGSSRELWYFLLLLEGDLSSDLEKQHKAEIQYRYTLPFKSLGSLRNVYIFQRKAVFSKKITLIKNTHYTLLMW